MASVAQIHIQLQAQFSNLSDDFARVHSDLDEANEANGRLQAQLQKAAADAQQFKAKYEKDITIVTEELENTKLVVTQQFPAQRDYYSFYILVNSDNMAPILTNTSLTASLIS